MSNAKDETPVTNQDRLKAASFIMTGGHIMYSLTDQQKLDHLNLLLSGAIHDSMVKKWASYVDADKFKEDNVHELTQFYQKQMRELMERCADDVKSWQDAHGEVCEQMNELCALANPGQCGKHFDILKQGIEKLKQERVAAEENFKSASLTIEHHLKWFQELRKLLCADENENLMEVIKDRVNFAYMNSELKYIADLLKDEPAAQNIGNTALDLVRIVKKERDYLLGEYQASQREINDKCQVIKERNKNNGDLCEKLSAANKQYNDKCRELTALQEAVSHATLRLMQAAFGSHSVPASQESPRNRDDF